MPQMQPLPPGLSPVQAGRFGLWLMGRLNHVRARRRTLSASRTHGRGARELSKRFITLLLPWKIYEYPGHAQAMSEICGVARDTARQWFYKRDLLPAKHARKLERMAREKASEWAAVADELAGYASAKERKVSKDGMFGRPQRPE